MGNIEKERKTLSSESQKDTKKLKIHLIAILNNKTLSEKEVVDLIIPEDQTNGQIPFYEISKEEIPYLFIPFIRGTVLKEKDVLINFIRNMIKIDIFEAKDSSPFLPEKFSVANFVDESITEQEFSPKKTLADILDGKLERNTKIYMNNAVRSFNVDYFDWDDREFMKEVLKTCIYKSLLFLRSLISEESVIKYKNDEEEAKSIQAYRFLQCGHLNPITPVTENTRKDLLKRRFEPTQTVDEYVDKLLEKQKVAGEDDSSKKKKEKDLKALREEDEENDRIFGFRGNTKNTG